MPALGELLERFRHAATPGPPAAAGGVPVDAAAALESELRPLIAALDQIEEEAGAIVSEAETGAARTRALAAREAERILAEARRQAAALRVEPPGDDEEEDPELRAVLGRAEAEAARIRARAQDRIPGLVSRVTRCVSEGPGPAPDWPLGDGEGAAVRAEDRVAGLGRR